MRWTRRSAVAVTTAAVLVGGGLALAQGAASRSLPATAVPASSSTSVDGSVEDLLTQVDALEAAVAAGSVNDRGRSSDDPATHDLLDDSRNRSGDGSGASGTAGAGVDDSGDTWDDSDGRVGGESGRGSDDTHADDRGGDDHREDDHRDDDHRDDDHRGGDDRDDD